MLLPTHSQLCIPWVTELACDVLYELQTLTFMKNPDDDMLGQTMDRGSAATRSSSYSMTELGAMKPSKIPQRIPFKFRQNVPVAAAGLISPSDCQHDICENRSGEREGSSSCHATRKPSKIPRRLPLKLRQNVPVAASGPISPSDSQHDICENRSGEVEGSSSCHATRKPSKIPQRLPHKFRQNVSVAAAGPISPSDSLRGICENISGEGEGSLWCGATMKPSKIPQRLPLKFRQNIPLAASGPISPSGSLRGICENRSGGGERSSSCHATMKPSKIPRRLPIESRQNAPFPVTGTRPNIRSGTMVQHQHTSGTPQKSREGETSSCHATLKPSKIPQRCPIQAGGNVWSPAEAVVHETQSDKAILGNRVHLLSSTEVDKLIHKADEITRSKDTIGEEKLHSQDLTGMQDMAVDRSKVTREGMEQNEQPGIMISTGNRNVENLTEIEKVLGLEATTKADEEKKPAAAGHDAKRHAPPKGNDTKTNNLLLKGKSPPKDNDTETEQDEQDLPTKKKCCKCCVVM